jgi:hypothetical protein
MRGGVEVECPRNIGGHTVGVYNFEEGVNDMAFNKICLLTTAAVAAIGCSSMAEAQCATALNGAVSCNANAIATGANSTATGNLATATGTSSSAYGDSSFASGNFSTALGDFAAAQGFQSTAVGDVASAYRLTQAHSGKTPTFLLQQQTARRWARIPV